MPIQRFRDFDEPRQALWVERDDPQLGERIRRLWEFSRRLVPERFMTGVARYRTLEEAGLDRDARIAERVARMRRARRPKA
jgi:hypothetical protein